jgi:hypothetical protein
MGRRRGRRRRGRRRRRRSHRPAGNPGHPRPGRASGRAWRGTPRARRNTDGGRRTRRRRRLRSMRGRARGAHGRSRRAVVGHRSPLWQTRTAEQRRLLLPPGAPRLPARTRGRSSTDPGCPGCYPSRYSRPWHRPPPGATRTRPPGGEGARVHEAEQDEGREGALRSRASEARAAGAVPTDCGEGPAGGGEPARRAAWAADEPPPWERGGTPGASPSAGEGEPSGPVPAALGCVSCERAIEGEEGQVWPGGPCGHRICYECLTRIDAASDAPECPACTALGTGPQAQWRRIRGPTGRTEWRHDHDSRNRTEGDSWARGSLRPSTQDATAPAGHYGYPRPPLPPPPPGAGPASRTEGCQRPEPTPTRQQGPPSAAGAATRRSRRRTGAEAPEMAAAAARQPRTCAREGTQG